MGEPCKIGENAHYGPHCKTHAEDRPLIECIREVQREVAQLRALLHEAYPAMMDRREAHPEWMRQAEAALARERKEA